MFCSLNMTREICVFAKIWFVKTWTIIMKYKSQVTKLNPEELRETMTSDLR